MHDGRRLLVLLLAVTLLWPLQELAGGVLARGGYHLGQVVALRYIAHLLILLPVAFAWRGLAVLRTSRPGLQLLRGLCMFGMPAGYILAIDFGSNQWIWTVFWLSPLLAMVGAAVVVRERSPAAAWAVGLVGATGAAVVMGAAPGGLLVSLFALVMGGSFAAYLVLSRVLRGEPLMTSLIYTAVGALLPMLLIVWRVWTPVSTDHFATAAVTGLLGVGILAFLDLAAATEPVWKSAILLPLVVVWEIGLATGLHRRTLGSADLLGGALILLATAAAATVVVRHAGRSSAASAGTASSPVLDVHHG